MHDADRRAHRGSPAAAPRSLFNRPAPGDRERGQAIVAVSSERFDGEDTLVQLGSTRGDCADLTPGEPLLGEIALRYRAALDAYFRRRVRPPHECEDLTQEVLLRLARRAQGAPIANIQPYVFQTAASVLTDHVRRRTARHWNATEEYREDQHAQPDVSPEQALLERESADRLAREIAALPERARQALFLFRIEGMKQAAIAAHMGISVSAVEKHIKLGMVRLAAALAVAE